MEQFFDKSQAFESYTSMHLSPVILISVFCLAVIFGAKNLNEGNQRLVGTCFASIAALAVITRMIFIYYEGIFSIKSELPFHLCRILALSSPFVMYFKNERWINAMYYMATVGALQSILTPELSYGMPHYEYLLYWILHTILFWVPFYAIIVYKIRPDFRGVKEALIFCNVAMIFTLIVNLCIGSNYLYTRNKPSTGSMLDFMGPWPWYLVTAQFIAFALFFLAYLPFRKGK